MAERQNSVLKNRIRELDEEKREFLQSRDKALKNLGESIFGRLQDGAFPGEESEYRRFRQEIADSEQKIVSIKDALARLDLLDEEINVKNEEKFDRKEELEILLTALGKELFDGSYDLPESLASCQKQFALCRSRKESVEKRIQDVEDGSGIFGQISGGIKTMIFRLSLKKYETHLSRIYCDAGAKYLDEKKGESEIVELPVLGPLFRDAVSLRRVTEELEEALGTLEGEKRKIEVSLGGRASRHIRALEDQAEKSREGLGELYRKMGENAVLDHPAVSGILTEQDRSVLEEADRLRKNADEKTREIEKIEAAISMNKETVELSKLEKAMDRGKSRIAEEERNVAELNRKISETKTRIENLRKR
jgi:chromosome segregation ATPase